MNDYWNPPIQVDPSYGTTGGWGYWIGTATDSIVRIIGAIRGDETSYQVPGQTYVPPPDDTARPKVSPLLLAAIGWILLK